MSLFRPPIPRADYRKPLRGLACHRARCLVPKTGLSSCRVVHFSEAAFKFGIETHSVDGGALRVYSPAKTVADCFKFRSKTGMETAIQALRSAYREKKATMDELWRAAKVCRVVNVMRPYMESLI